MSTIVRSSSSAATKAELSQGGIDDTSPIEDILKTHSNAGGGSFDTLSSFNSIATLNELFPDETSIERLETVQDCLAEDGDNLQNEINTLYGELRRDQNPQKMQHIQEMISDLMTQMSRIREKATESEAVVRNITKDIQRLDLAKKNVAVSMTTLKRFQMLANSLGQLEDLVRDKAYSDASQTLAAVKELAASFKPFLSVPQVAILWARLQAAQGGLRTKLDRDFDVFFLADSSNPINPSFISNACRVVDVIGDDFRSHLIERYCSTELKEHRRIFRVSDEAGQLDNLPRRFAFFRRTLQTHDTTREQVFPLEWRVGEHMCAKFIDYTREDLTALLNKAGKSLTLPVLLQALQQSLDFETFVCKKYSKQLFDLPNMTIANVPRSARSLTSTFEPHMGIFLDAQNKVLSDMLSPHRGKRSRISLDAPPTTNSDISTATAAIVLPSSTELFYFYGQVLEQCSNLFNGKPLYELANLQKKWLRIYAEDVLSPSLKPVAQAQRSSSDVRFDINEVKSYCLTINTAEYCQITAIDLEEKIISKIAPEYKDKVSFQSERDLFTSTASSSIFALLRELEATIDPSFEIMSKTSWAYISTVTGPSRYVGELTRIIDSFMDAISHMIEPKKYLRNFYDKASTLVLSRFTNALVKSRPLKECGAEQKLLLDLQELRACLLKIPGDISTSTSYGKTVSRNTTRLETLLKVIIPPANPVEGFVLNYILLIGDASFSNFQKVLDLKGTPRSEQNGLIDNFIAITSTKPELENVSFLSSLDMEPHAAQHALAFSSPPGSRVHLPSLLAGAGTGTLAAEGNLDTLSSPPVSGPPTGSDVSSRAGDAVPKREVFSEFRKLVNFSLRRESVPPS